MIGTGNAYSDTYFQLGYDLVLLFSANLPDTSFVARKKVNVGIPVTHVLGQSANATYRSVLFLNAA